MVVEVVRGDIDDIRQELQRRYTGNLCVVVQPGLSSLDDLTRLQREVQPALDSLMRTREFGIYAIGNDGDSLTVDLVILATDLLDRLT